MIRNNKFEFFIRAIQIFLNPRSPAAVYKNPYPFFAQIFTRSLNKVIKMIKDGSMCNICGRMGKFGLNAAISINSISRNDICLTCYSNKRTRTLAYYFKNFLLNVNFPLNILDIGPLESTRLFFRNFDYKYLTLDKFRKTDFCDDITNMKSIPDMKMDYVLCLHVLEHIPNDFQAMKEIKRVLRINGSAFIMVRQITGLKKTNKNNISPFNGYGHIWSYGFDFEERLIKAGFKVKILRPKEIFDKNDFKKYGLCDDLIYSCESN